MRSFTTASLKVMSVVLTIRYLLLNLKADFCTFPGSMGGKIFLKRAGTVARRIIFSVGSYVRAAGLI